MEGLLCFLWLIFIPPDPKNAFFFGFSKFRWIQIFIILAGTVILTVTSNKLIQLIHKSSKNNILKILSISSILILVLVLFTPSYRLKPYSAEFERLRPLLSFGLLCFSNIYFFIKLSSGDFSCINLKHNFWSTRKLILTSFVILLFFIIWFFLKQFFSTQLQEDLIFAPPAPVSSFQVFMIIVIAWVLNQKGVFNSTNKKLIISISVVIFISTVLLWTFTSMPCTDDRIGPFPPNYICYPSNNDAIYSIASHYGRLGTGIYNHWFTDKPLYIFFLMVTQWLSSPNIDHYIRVQTIFLSLIPVILFLFTRRIHSILAGLVISLLMIIREVNNLSGYQMFGAINTRLEATEILTSLLLIVFGITLFYWFNNKKSILLPSISGVILGIASLTRLNPVFILPVTIVAIFFLYKKNFKHGVLISIIFSLGFLSSFLPWYVFSTDSIGQNHLFLKLNEIIQTRYKTSENHDFENNLSLFKNAIPSQNAAFREQEINDPTRITLHFLNNNLEVLATLPMDFIFHSPSYQSGLPVWKNQSGYPIWSHRLSFTNIIIISLNLFLIIIGIIYLFNKFGIAGLTPLIIQIGYTFGNGVAITSGGRYIIPIIWVSYLYFSIGVVYFIGITQRVINSSKNIVDQKFYGSNIENSNLITEKQKIIILVILLVSFFFSFGLTKLDLIPNKFDHFLENPSIILGDHLSREDLELITKNENLDIFYGYSYQPKYFRNNFFNTAPESFELVTLTKDKVVVSYINDIQKKYFSDESKTVIIGCPIAEEIRWGAEFLIVDAFVIVQLDNEESMYISNMIDWNCNINQ